MKRIGIFLVCMMIVTSFLVIFPVENVIATEEIFYPMADTTIGENNPNLNFGTETAVWTRYYSGWTLQSLVRFDLSSIPSGTDIVYAKLNLYYYWYNDVNPADDPLNVYRITSDWDELSVTWNTQPSYTSEITATTNFPLNIGAWIVWNVTSDVQDFIDGTKLNLGWLIDAYSTDNAMADFYSKEYGSFIPYLEIEIVSPDNVYVDNDYDSSTPGWQYDHFDVIQDGIDAVAEGGTVYVYSGTYNENVLVDKTINLIGENKNTAIIIGNTNYDAMEITAPNVDVKDFMVKGGTHGIDINSNYCEISNNIVKDNGYTSIEINGNFNVISENNVSGNISNPEGHGIELRHSTLTSQNNIVRNNSIKDCYYGIDIVEDWGNSKCSNNTIFGNLITDCLIGIYINGDNNFNLLYHNSLISNNQNAYDECINTWDHGYSSGGNYWDDYTGNDNYHGLNQDIPGADGIGDIPYDILGADNQDLYPLMYPCGQPILINIDIKPGDYPNSINVNSKGNVPVAILTNDAFDASIVDPDAIIFLDASPIHWALDDVDKDGDIDMILHFKTQELNFSLLVDEGDEYPYAYLTGETISGELVEGKDTVRLVGQKAYIIIEWLIQYFPFFEKILDLFNK